MSKQAAKRKAVSHDEDSTESHETHVPEKKLKAQPPAAKGGKATASPSKKSSAKPKEQPKQEAMDTAEDKPQLPPTAAASVKAQPSTKDEKKQAEGKTNAHVAMEPPKLNGAPIVVRQQAILVLNPKINKLAHTLFLQQANSNWIGKVLNSIQRLQVTMNAAKQMGIGFCNFADGEKDEKTKKPKVPLTRLNLVFFGSIMNTSKIDTYGDHKCEYNRNMKSEYATPELKNSKYQVEIRSVPKEVLAWLGVQPDTPETDFMVLELRSHFPKMIEMENQLRTLYQEDRMAAGLAQGSYSELVHRATDDYRFLRPRTNIYIKKTEEMKKEEETKRKAQAAWKAAQKAKKQAEGTWTDADEKAPLPIDVIPKIDYDPSGLHEKFARTEERADYVHKPLPFTDDDGKDLSFDSRKLGPTEKVGYPDIVKCSISIAIHVSKCHGWAVWLNGLGKGVRVPQTFRDSLVASTTDDGNVESASFTGFSKVPKEAASGWDDEVPVYNMPDLEKDKAAANGTEGETNGAGSSDWAEAATATQESLAADMHE